MTNKISRCPWPDGDEKMIKYHDQIWGVPVRDDQMLFAKLSLDLMQAGLMWRTILHKWDNFFDAFDGFDIAKVAAFDEAKFDQLMQNKGIVRNKLKIAAIINNAAKVTQVQKELGSFSNYIWSFVNNKPIKNDFESIDQIPARSALSDQISKDLLKRGFKFVGSTIIYAWLQAVGVVNDHLVGCFRREQV